jgi:hypothetical protein
MPQIGEVSPGLWVATAFGSHGLNTSAMAGELIARAIAETDDRWRLFGSYDLVYAGGAIGRATAQVLFWFMRGRDALDEQIAWRRAATRRRNKALAARAAEEARQRVAADAQRRAAADAERRVVGEADAAERTAERAGRLAMQEAAREVSDQAAHIAAGEAAHRVAGESARLAADAERLAAAERPAAANAARIPRRRTRSPSSGAPA